MLHSSTLTKSCGESRTARDRLSGLCLNDVGPEIDKSGLDKIFDYIGRNPAGKTLDEVARRVAAQASGFSDVPEGRWLQDAIRHYTQTAEGVRINYDPALREAFLDAFKGEAPDLWPLWSATEGMPVALIRGANSDLLTAETAQRMAQMRPDLIFAEVPGRAHIPWLDEAPAVEAIRKWLEAVSAQS